MIRLELVNYNLDQKSKLWSRLSLKLP